MIRRLWRMLEGIVFACGLLLLVIVYLATTNIPWRWYESMALPARNPPGEPDVLVMLGGGGIPSESGLMRSWKTAEASRLFSNAMVIVAMPIDNGESDSYGIEHELAIRGVDAGRIRRESRGRNTREQALEIRRMLSEDGKAEVTLGLVTSPEHMRRSWLSFRKAGFSTIVALPSWPDAIDVDLSYSSAELGGAKAVGSMIGGSSMLKYRFWDNIGYLMRCTRETVAIWYYRLMGWV